MIRCEHCLEEIHVPEDHDPGCGKSPRSFCGTCGAPMKEKDNILYCSNWENCPAKTKVITP